MRGKRRSAVRVYASRDRYFILMRERKNPALSSRVVIPPPDRRSLMDSSSRWHRRISGNSKYPPAASVVVGLVWRVGRQINKSIRKGGPDSSGLSRMRERGGNRAKGEHILLWTGWLKTSLKGLGPGFPCWTKQRRRSIAVGWMTPGTILRMFT